MGLLQRLVITSLWLVMASATAQDFPTRPIEVYVGYGAGGGSDLSIRLTEGAASKLLGQKIIVQNRPGAAGTVMMNQFIKAAPDGYTLAIGSTATLTVQPHTASDSVLFKPDDYVPIVQISNVPNFLIVPTNSPIKTFKEFIEHARKSQPGQIKAGITSLGTTLHLPFVQLEKLYNLKFTYIPHKSSAPVVTAVMGGHIDVGAADMAAAAAQIRAGTVRALGIFAPERLPSLPDVPTLKEQGANVEAGFYNMLLAPKGTPERVVARLHDAFRKVLQDPEVVQRAGDGGVPIEYLDGAASRARLESNYKIYGELLKDLGLAK
jgi:tripartite-type tricarboxylate transporter receptor subunit TctC